MADEAGVILVVEDNPDHAEMTMRALKKANVSNEIVLAQDGAEALDYLFGTGSYKGRNLKKLPQLIMLDLKLPKIDGLEVLRRIRADERMRCLPVVVLTSSDEQRDIVETCRAGVNSFVRKPVRFSEFSEAVGKIGLYWTLTNRTVRAHN